MKTLNIALVRPNATIPTRGTEHSAGYDLYACIESTIVIEPNATALIATGIAIDLGTPNSVALVYPRSSMGVKYNVSLANGVGVIDADYRGEIHVCLINHSCKDYIVQPNDRIAQMVITPIHTPELVVIESLSETQRGSGGFGSTGK